MDKRQAISISPEAKRFASGQAFSHSVDDISGEF
jgi:hypothetical protein